MAAEDDDDVKPWVLYVARSKGDFCKGSSLCLRLIENLGLDDMIVIQDCNALHERGVVFPDWLTGSPTLVHRESFTKFTGSDAVAQLSALEGNAAAMASREDAGRVAPSVSDAAPPSVASARQQRIVEDDGHRSQQESKLAEMMQARQYGAMSGVGDMPPPSATPRRPASYDPFDDDAHSEQGDNGSLGIEDILKSPPSESPMDNKRVTENDVNRFMEERKRFDDMQKQRMNGGPQM